MGRGLYGRQGGFRIDLIDRSTVRELLEVSMMG